MPRTHLPGAPMPLRPLASSDGGSAGVRERCCSLYDARVWSRSACVCGERLRSVHGRLGRRRGRLCGAMVLYTKKDAAAERDPRRFRILPPSGIAGTSDADSQVLQKAYAYLDSVHRAPCVLGRTPLVVQRMPVLGIANDINYIVRAFALAHRNKAGGQLLLLPPARAPAHGRVASNNRESLVVGRSIENPWHWFDGLPRSSLGDIFTPSACQERLQQPDEIGRLRALDEISRNSTLANAANSLGLGSEVFDVTHNAIRALSRGMTLSDVPVAFREHGMLWWWQALTTYLVRVRGPLAARLQGHVAMAALVRRQAGRSAASTAAQREWLATSRLALQSAVRGGQDDVGWVPPLAFDAALHVRMGDACGPHAKANQGIVRKCVQTLRAGLAPLLAHGVVPRGGRIFLATDSPRIIAEAEAAAPSLPFEVYYLAIDRNKYDTSAWIELASARQRTQVSILEETLLDLLLLSRARYVAGSMYGNVPRLALQLRPTAPGDARRLAYITTDGRDWCTTPTCMKNNTATGRFW